MLDNKPLWLEKSVNILLNVLIGIFGVVLLVSLYSSVQVRILGNSHANFFGYSIFEVQTKSMSPTIEAGDWIIVRLTETAKINDIITFEYKGNFVTHRVVQVFGSTYVTQGDANNTKDEPVDQEQVVGRMVSTLNGFGIFRKTLFNPAVLIALIVTLYFVNSLMKKEDKHISLIEKVKSLPSLLKQKRVKKEKPDPVTKSIFEEKPAYDPIAAIEKTLTNFERPKEIVVEKKDEEPVSTPIPEPVVEKPEPEENWFAEAARKEREEAEELKEEPVEEAEPELPPVDIIEPNDELDQTSVFRAISIDTSEEEILLLEELAEELPEIEVEEELPAIEIEEEPIVEPLPEVEIEPELKDISEVLKEETEIKIPIEELLKPEPEIEEEQEEGTPLDINPINDLSATNILRVIPVDLSDVDSTKFEIAENAAKIEQEEKEEAEEKALAEAKRAEEEAAAAAVVEETEEETGLTDIELELDNEPEEKQSKNLIHKMINLKKDELFATIALFEPEKLQTNEASIRGELVTTYIYAKYYDYVEDPDFILTGKAFSKIDKIFKLKGATLESEYKGNDSNYAEKVQKYLKLFKLITVIESIAGSNEDIKTRRVLYPAEIKNYDSALEKHIVDDLVDRIIKIQRKYTDKENKFFRKLDTDTFYNTYDKITTKKDWSLVTLEHNITFNKAYSEYIINQTYTKGLIAEDKLSVQLTLLASRLVNDMLTGEFNKKYLIHIPESLYKKEKKLWRILKIIDDEYAKAHVLIVATCKDMNTHKAIIKKMKKLAFKIALVFERNSNSKRQDILHMANVIFVDKKDNSFKKIISTIPDDMLENVVYDDIIDKISSIGVSEGDE